MATPISCFFDNLSIGAVFTPPDAASFAVETFHILDLWLGAKTILDPTMGEGNLLEALVESALAKGHALAELPLHTLFGVESNVGYHKSALLKFKKKYCIDMSGNFYCQDIITFNDVQADVLFGNPPWCNFADLPEAYKVFIKPYFLE